MKEYPDIKVGTVFDETHVVQWNKLIQEHAAMYRTVFGAADTVQSSSGILVSPRRARVDAKPSDRTVVIIRKPVEGDEELLVRRARYAQTPPVPCTGDGETAVCRYEWAGDDFRAFPALGTKPITYDGDEWDGAQKPKLTTVFYRSHRDDDLWILDPPAKGGSNIDIGLVVTTTGASSFIQIRRVKLDSSGALVWANVNPQTGVAVSETVKCWEGTDAAFWSEFKPGTLGGTPTPSSQLYVPLMTIRGVEYAIPVWAFIATAPITPALPRGSC